jgi:dihydroneopterin aldolase
MNIPPDELRITGIELDTTIGVPEEERARSQTLWADVAMRLNQRCDLMADDLGGTVDYAAVTEAVRELARSRPRHLIETLASEIAACILEFPHVEAVAVEVRKRILPRVDHVAIRVERVREPRRARR